MPNATPASTPPRTPTTTDTTWPDPVPAPGTCSAVAAAASTMTTTGVANPSLRPLSTLSARRTRSAIRVSEMTVALSDASVAASTAATRMARIHVMWGSTTKPTTVPRAIDTGRPMASSLKGHAAS